MSLSTAPLSDSITTTPGPAEPVHQIPCAICRRQFSKYTCSRCNIPYCSLVCFRSQTHADCSEAFYRNELESDIQSAPSKTAEERMQILELLKRFEEGNEEGGASELELDGVDGAGDEDGPFPSDSGSSDLAARLGNLDLDSVAPDDLWTLLTPEERQRFLKAVEDPQSELAQTLLASAELEQHRAEPWWDAPSSDLEGAAEATLIRPAVIAPAIFSGAAKKHGKQPEAMEIPSSLIPKDPAAGVHLLYNISALCIAYAHVTRQLSISPLSLVLSDDPDAHEARRLLAGLAPFVTDRKSTVVHPSLDSVVTDIWARFEQETMTPALFALLLGDASRLLMPPRISELPIASPSPLATSALLPTPLLLVLSDLRALFLQPSAAPGTTVPKENHVTRKLTFYAARAVTLPARVLELLSAELRSRSSLEYGKSTGEVPTHDVGLRPQHGVISQNFTSGIAEGAGARSKGNLIEEIG